MNIKKNKNGSYSEKSIFEKIADWSESDAGACVLMVFFVFFGILFLVANGV